MEADKSSPSIQTYGTRNYDFVIPKDYDAKYLSIFPHTKLRKVWRVDDVGTKGDRRVSIHLSGATDEEVVAEYVECSKYLVGLYKEDRIASAILKMSKTEYSRLSTVNYNKVGTEHMCKINLKPRKVKGEYSLVVFSDLKGQGEDTLAKVKAHIMNVCRPSKQRKADATESSASVVSILPASHNTNSVATVQLPPDAVTL